jgi:oligosaccharyltransferase complex subunit beta
VNPENYRIKDELVFEVDLEERRADGSLQPFKSADMQLEFIRLDPYHRLFLQQEGSSATYKAQLEVPDTLGVYKFKVSHQRYGYSNIEAETIVSCIQFRHDEYPRFLNIAVPYYLNVFMVMGAGFLFITFFLYSEIETGTTKQHKKG